MVLGETTLFSKVSKKRSGSPTGEMHQRTGDVRCRAKKREQEPDRRVRPLLWGRREASESPTGGLGGRSRVVEGSESPTGEIHQCTGNDRDKSRANVCGREGRREDKEES